MRSLNKISIPPTYVSYLISIRDAKRVPVIHQGTANDHKAILNDAHIVIASRYTLFEQAVGARNTESVIRSPSMHNIRVSLRSCYDNDSKGVRTVKRAIAAAQGVRVLKYCPMCGITLVATHDHYLPASLFPELAVHPLNLVPCCSTCNSTKGDDWLDATGARLYVHAYSDLIPAEAFLHVQLSSPAVATGVGATFSISRPFRFSRAAWRIVEKHFDNLNLIDRYTELANDEIAEILADCGVYRSAGGTNVRRFLESKAADREQVYGASHWQVVLMRELASSAQLNRWVGRVRV